MSDPIGNAIGGWTASLQVARDLRRQEEDDASDDIYYPDGGDQPRAYYVALKDMRAVQTLMSCADRSPIAREMLDELLAEGEK